MTMRRSFWSSSARGFNLCAYSRAVSGSWIEHGPTMTRSLSSFSVRIFWIAFRAVRTVCVDREDYPETINIWHISKAPNKIQAIHKEFQVKGFKGPYSGKFLLNKSRRNHRIISIQSGILSDAIINTSSSSIRIKHLSQHTTHILRHTGMIGE